MAEYDDIDELVSGSESTDPTVGRYFKVEVPDYTNSGTNPKISYMRVGSPRTDWQNEPGADLAALAYLVGTAGNKFGDATLAQESAALAALSPVYPDIAGTDLADPFVDDQRTRGSDTVAGSDDASDRPDRAPGHGLSKAQRREVSARLHSDLGWRDHTDGNRISTTRGDRVDVVYGNYKMVVMGRQSDPADAMAWDVTGNHIQDFGGGTMPGASVVLEWVPDTTYGTGADKGAWLLQNSTERVYQYSRNAGNFRVENWGDLLENYIGSENPENFGTTETAGMQGHPLTRDIGGAPAPIASSVGLPRGNPHIIEKTWASRIDSYTGTDALKVPDIHEETHVERSFSKTNAFSIVENVNSLDIVSSTNAVLIIESTIAPLQVSTQVGGIIEIFIGLKLSLELAGTITVAAPFALEATFGYNGSFHNLKDEMALLENDLKATKNELTTTKNILATTRNRLSGVANSLTKTNNKLSDVQNDLATRVTQVNVNYKVLAVQINIG
jgi:hypothetical protein